MARLAGKVALVTGAAGGLGSAIAQRFGEEGALLVLTGTKEAAVKAVCAKLKAQGCEAIGLRHDIRSADDWKHAIDTTISTFGGLDILVNNAAVAMLGSIEDCTIEDWRRIHGVNLEGTFLGTQAGVAAMKARGGSIINLSSIRALVGDPMSVAYDASKAGVTALTKSAALHCAKQGYGIRINSIHPSYVMTDMVRNAIEAMPNPEAIFKAVVDSHPIGRFGEARDIANAALYLASDESAFVVGAQIVVDGGYCAQ
jgi:NAD(P)-dependent dehydrogenase (short-subunit alcohol dehydrogenase family)